MKRLIKLTDTFGNTFYMNKTWVGYIYSASENVDIPNMTHTPKSIIFEPNDFEEESPVYVIEDKETIVREMDS